MQKNFLRLINTIRNVLDCSLKNVNIVNTVNNSPDLIRISLRVVISTECGNIFFYFDVKYARFERANNHE